MYGGKAGTADGGFHPELSQPLSNSKHKKENEAADFSEHSSQMLINSTEFDKKMEGKVDISREEILQSPDEVTEPKSNGGDVKNLPAKSPKAGPSKKAHNKYKKSKSRKKEGAKATTTSSIDDTNADGHATDEHQSSKTAAAFPVVLPASSSQSDQAVPTNEGNCKLHFGSLHTLKSSAFASMAQITSPVTCYQAKTPEQSTVSRADLF